MTFTFTKEEVERMLDWAGVAACEGQLATGDDELIKRMTLAVAKDFSDMTNSERIMDFLMKANLPICIHCKGDEPNCYMFEKEGEDALLIPEDTDYVTAIQQILNYENS